MTDREQPREGVTLPEPVVVRGSRWRVPLIWLVPLVAAAIGVSLVVGVYVSTGPSIDISFETAEGIEPDRTQVKHKDVVIGKVKEVTLSKDRARVQVKVDLEKKYASFATAGSRFWVVRPRVGFGGVSGLRTLFSGSYIGADTGDSNEKRTRFRGLERPPPLTHGEPGSSYVLQSDDLGSLDIGSPVYYRRIQVGRVLAYDLEGDGKSVRLQLFVQAPYDQLVTSDSRFWNASGVDVSIDSSGFKLNTESLATVIAGGVAFQTPPDDEVAPRAVVGSRFRLFASREAAMKPAAGPSVPVRMRFPQSVRGLAAGAQVDFQGIAIGEVRSIRVDYDPKRERFPVDVAAVLSPQRLGRAYRRFVERIGEGHASNPGAALAILVKHGLRAQLRNANLLTGQLYVALDFFPKEPSTQIDPNQEPIEIPTVGSTLDRIQRQAADIAEKLDKVPFDRIGRRLDEGLRGIDRMLGQINGELAPEARETLEQARRTLAAADQAVSADSPLQQNLGRTLHELQRAARSVRVFSDYLNRHPESLLLGRPDDPPPQARGSEANRP
jgi:paraquat-inducible protein B